MVNATIYHENKCKYEGEEVADLRNPGRSRLPELLEANHLMAKELALMLDVTESHISQIINGKKFFSYPLAALASQILHCTMEELHYWD